MSENDGRDAAEERAAEATTTTMAATYSATAGATPGERQAKTPSLDAEASRGLLPRKRTTVLVVGVTLVAAVGVGAVGVVSSPAEQSQIISNTAHQSAPDWVSGDHSADTSAGAAAPGASGASGDSSPMVDSDLPALPVPSASQPGASELGAPAQHTGGAPSVTVPQAGVPSGSSSSADAAAPDGSTPVAVPDAASGSPSGSESDSPSDSDADAASPNVAAQQPLTSPVDPSGSSSTPTASSTPSVQSPFSSSPSRSGWRLPIGAGPVIPSGHGPSPIPPMAKGAQQSSQNGDQQNGDQQNGDQQNGDQQNGDQQNTHQQDTRKRSDHQRNGSQQNGSSSTCVMGDAKLALSLERGSNGRMKGATVYGFPVDCVGKTVTLTMQRKDGKSPVQANAPVDDSGNARFSFPREVPKGMAGASSISLH